MRDKSVPVSTAMEVNSRALSLLRRKFVEQFAVAKFNMSEHVILHSLQFEHVYVERGSAIALKSLRASTAVLAARLQRYAVVAGGLCSISGQGRTVHTR